MTNIPKAGPGLRDRLVTTAAALVLLALIAWMVSEYNLLLLAWVGGGVAMLVLVVWFTATWRNGWRWLFSRRALRFHFWVLAGLVSMVLLFYAEENWRGKRSWAKLQGELEQRGESVRLETVIPSPIPDDLNFAAAPGVRDALGFPPTNATTFFHGDPPGWPEASWARGQFTDLTQWQKVLARSLAGNGTVAATSETKSVADDVLLLLSRFDEPLTVLRAASARPGCRYPFNYTDAWLSISGKIFDNLHNAASVLRLRACAQLQSGAPDAALDDILLLLRLADTLKEEPFAVAHRLRLEMLMLAVQPCWEGLARHRWSNAHLSALRERFSALNPRQEFRRAAKGETLLMIHLASQFEAYLEGRPSVVASQLNKSEGADALLLWLVKVFYPAGWPAQDRVWLYRFYQRYGDVDTAAGRRALDDGSWRSELRKAMDPTLPIFVVPRVRMVIDDGATWGLYLETVKQQMIAACALETFWVQKGGFPSQPGPDLPESMQYETAGTGYRLYSVGWNGTDEGGQVAKGEEHWRSGTSLVPQLEQGDWVWAIPSISQSQPE